MLTRPARLPNGSLTSAKRRMQRYPQWIRFDSSRLPVSVNRSWALKESARQRLHSSVAARSEWCVSRQRSWGVPIPILFDESGQPVLKAEVMSHVLSTLEVRGTDHWWNGPMEDFIPHSLAKLQLSRSRDTLDVWFDSGSTWTLLANLPRTQQEYFADLCLEGSDQHRGWFQSLLLTTTAASSETGPVYPYRNLITHGFILDEKGEKMSKSAGNGLSPIELIAGTEVCRICRFLADQLAEEPGLWSGCLAPVGRVN